MAIIQAGKRKANKREFFETPPKLCDVAVGLLTSRVTQNRPRFLDAGAGTGNWGRAVVKRFRDRGKLVGVDLYFSRPKIQNPYSEFHQLDFSRPLTAGFPGIIAGYTAIVGNPPFKSAEQFVRVAYDLLIPGGYILFLLRLSFLESIKRHHGLWNDLPPEVVYVLAERIPWANHKQGKNGKTDDTAYALYLWRKPLRGTCKGHSTLLDWLSWR